MNILYPVIAVLTAYLLGAIPSAYIITRLLTGKDIRKLGSGNVGANNVFIYVGKWAGIGVGVFDFAKAVAAMVIAFRLLDVPVYQTSFLILLAALAAVCGHIWPVYLKLQGGNGLAVTVGVLLMMLPRELAIIIGLTLMLVVINRKLITSFNLSLLTLPISTLFIEKSWLAFLFTIVLLTVLVFNFMGDLRNDARDAGGTGNLFASAFKKKPAAK